MLKFSSVSGSVKIGLLAAVVGALSACGGGSSASSDATASAANAASAAPVTAADASQSSGNATPHVVTAAYGGVHLPAGHQLTALTSSCEICHSFDMVYTQRLSKATWTVEVTKMMKFGSPLPKSDKTAVIAYLTKYLGPSVPRSTNRATAYAPATTYSAAPAQ